MKNAVTWMRYRPVAPGRSTVRRAERRAVELRESRREVNPEVVRYLNRLSDLLFVLARKQAVRASPSA